MASVIQLHCNRHMAIDVPVCVDWFLTCQRDKMSFLERSQWLGAFQNCFRVRCEASTREIPSAKKNKDNAAQNGEGERVWGKKSIEGLSPHACTILSRVLLICVTRRFLRTYDRSRRNRSDETMRLSTLVTSWRSKIVLGWNLRGRIRTGSSILGYAWR